MLNGIAANTSPNAAVIGHEDTADNIIISNATEPAPNKAAGNRKAKSLAEKKWTIWPIQ